MDAAGRNRYRKQALLLLVVVTVVSGCSRMSFVRPDLSKTDYEHIGREVNVSDSSGNRTSNSVRNHLQLAQDRMLAGDYKQAEREARLALKADPKSADPYTMLGAIAERRGASQEAGDYYRRAAELAPTRGGALNNYGVWLCGQGRAAESLGWFDRALADSSYATPAVASANSGSCALRAGQDARAERDLRTALAMEPENPVALAAMAELQFKRGNAFEARAFSERRLAAAPADLGSLQLASQIEQKLGDTAAAARYVQRMRAEFPDAQGSGTGDDGKR